MFKSNLMNQLLQIVGMWTVYFLILFTSDSFSYSQNKPFFLIATVFYVLLTIFFLWRIKHPSQKVQSEENRV